jgi:hypothetical protein
MEEVLRLLLSSSLMLVVVVAAAAARLLWLPGPNKRLGRSASICPICKGAPRAAVSAAG